MSVLRIAGSYYNELKVNFYLVIVFPVLLPRLYAAACGTREWTAHQVVAPFEHLAFFGENRCIPAECERAVKLLLYTPTTNVV